jgi:hypothetical protein
MLQEGFPSLIGPLELSTPGNPKPFSNTAGKILEKRSRDRLGKQLWTTTWLNIQASSIASCKEQFPHITALEHQLH